jgi:hypothetical protein
LQCSVSESGVAYKEQSWLRVAHHDRKFRGGLPSVQRHDDQSLGHQCEIEGGPSNRIGSEKSAAIAGANSRSTQVSPHAAHLIKQFPTGTADELLAVNFAQNHAASAALELGQDIF